MFSHHSFISKPLLGQKPYCCFVDNKKAFDNIKTETLLFKLARNGITCKMYAIIKSIYDSLKTCVNVQSDLSDFFNKD